MSKHDDSATLGIIGVVLVLLFLIIPMNCWRGAYPYGPASQADVSVSRLYVDHSHDHSRYMVGTDRGVFEVDNSWWLGITNADEIYSTLKEGHRYRVSTKGNKSVGFFFQDYPHITFAEPLEGK